MRREPTLWRVATEYLFIRKLAPRSDLLNPLYAGGFDHETAREVDWVSGAALLVRREATDAVGLFDESFFLFSEEADWQARFRQAGWQVWFFPGAEVVHVGGASHGGRLYVENLRGQLRYFDKHRGPREAERLRRLLLVALRLRAARPPPPRVPRRRALPAFGRRADADPAVIVYLRLAFGTLCVLAPGWAVARAFGQRSMSAILAWTMAAIFVAWAAVFTFHRSIHLAVVGAGGDLRRARSCRAAGANHRCERGSRAVARSVSSSAGSSGTSRAPSRATGSSTRRASASSST